MTKEEIKQEAEEKANYFTNLLPFRSAYKEGYIDSAEPREKQIQIDAEQIRALQKQNGELTDKVKELEAQIEKMKGCENCKYKYIQDSCDLGEGTRTDPCLSCRSNNMWEFDND